RPRNHRARLPSFRGARYPRISSAVYRPRAPMRQRKTDVARGSAAVVLSLALLAGCAKPAPLAPARPGPELAATPVPFGPVTPTTPVAPSAPAPTPPPGEPTEIRGRIQGIEPPMPVAPPPPTVPPVPAAQTGRMVVLNF